MHWFIIVLDWLLLGPLFYIVGFILLFSSGCIFNHSKKTDFEWFAGFLFLLLIGVCLYRWKHLWEALHNWKVVAGVIGAYVGAGFLISLYKYIALLTDFKKYGVVEKERIIKDNPNWSHTQIAHQLSNDLEMPHHSIEFEDNKYFVRYGALPLANWWTFWPFFLLSVVIDPIERIVRELLAKLRLFYTNLAKKFAI